MSLRTYLTVICIFTLISLMHVYQRISMIEISYRIKQSERNLEQLLDRNRLLLYNVSALQSPMSLESRLPKIDYDFKKPEKILVAKSSAAGSRNGAVNVAERQNPLIRRMSRAFVLKTEAHATEK